MAATSKRGKPALDVTSRSLRVRGNSNGHTRAVAGERGELWWTLHRFSIGLQSRGDWLRIPMKRIVWSTKRSIIGLRQCALLGVNEVYGPTGLPPAY